MCRWTKAATLAITLTTATGLSAFGCDETPESPPNDAGVDVGTIPDPDTIPPEIVYRVPTDQQTRVSVRAPIQVTFSEPVKFAGSPASLFANDVLIPTTASLSANARVLTITPAAEIPVPANLSVQFDGITDIRGNALIRPPWSWSAPRWLEVGKPFQNPGTPKVLVAAAGPDERIGTFMLTEAGDFLTITGRMTRQPTDDWHALDNGFGFARSNSSVPRIVVDPQGRFVVAYKRDTGSIAVERFDGTRWVDLEASFSNASDQFFLAIDSDGILYLAYEEITSENESRLIVAAQTPTRPWSPVGGIVTDPATEKAPQARSFIIDKNGNPFLAYTTLGNTGDGRIRTWSKSKATWTFVGKALNETDDNVEGLAIATDSDANLFALASFSSRVLFKYRTQVLRFNGENWAVSGPDISRTPARNEWFFAGTRNGHLFASTSADGTLQTLDVTSASWSSSAPPPLTVPIEHLGVGTVDPAGAPVIAWTDQVNDVHVMRLNQ